MRIDSKLITYLEELSCLILTDEEKKRLQNDLSDIIGGMALLGDLDTENIPERSHPFDNVNAFREDEIQASFDRELILKNAALRNNDMFVTPKTFG